MDEDYLNYPSLECLKCGKWPHEHKDNEYCTDGDPWEDLQDVF